MICFSAGKQRRRERGKKLKGKETEGDRVQIKENCAKRNKDQMINEPEEKMSERTRIKRGGKERREHEGWAKRRIEKNARKRREGKERGQRTQRVRR